MRSTHEARLLGSARGVEQRREPPGRAHVRQRVEQRDVLRLGAPQRLARDGQEPAHLPGEHVAAHPRGEGLRVEPVGVRRVPRLVALDSPGQALELELGPAGVEQRQRAQARDRAAVADVTAPDLEKVLPSRVGREELDARLMAEGEHPVLPRPDEAGSELHHRPTVDRTIEHSPADTVARLEEHRIHAGGDQRARRRESGKPGADDRYVRLDGRALHGAMLITSSRQPGGLAGRRAEIAPTTDVARR